MATLNDDEQTIYSNHILSPQPYTPPSKELFAALETSHMPPSEPGSTIDDGQMSTHEDAYISSGSSARHSTSDIFGREMDDDLDQLKSRASSRSSLSSVPASVMIHSLDHTKLNIHDKIAGYTIEDEEASFGGFHDPPRSIRTIRQREAAFRKPSSVRAMQMHTEDEADDDGDEFLTPPRRRNGMRSPGSSPLKRSPYYSPSAPSNKPKAKKEYPLVLLHCTLLAPSLPVPGAALPQNQKVVEEVLPPHYWKRWRRLQEKAGSGVLRDRGVLISHPEDLYDMLEERLLESLELQRSRLDHGHFLGHEESGTGSEGELSDQGESETDGEQGEECPDCGGRVLQHGDSNRKWEIRVFAANGLMRAGAWAAAWKEMEKVDVEVGVWLPSDIRRSLQKRLADVAAEDTIGTAALDETSRPDTQSPSPSSHARASSVPDSEHTKSSDPTPSELGVKPPELREEKPKHQIALQTLFINYIRVLAGEPRNIALVLMSVLVVFLAFGSQRPMFVPQSALSSFPEVVGAAISPSLSVSVASMSAFSSSMPLVGSLPTPSAPVVMWSSAPPTSTSVESMMDPEVDEVNALPTAGQPSAEANIVEVESSPAGDVEEQPLSESNSLELEPSPIEDEDAQAAPKEPEPQPTQSESSASPGETHPMSSVAQSAPLEDTGEPETSSVPGDPTGSPQSELEDPEDPETAPPEATELFEAGPETESEEDELANELPME